MKPRSKIDKMLVEYADTLPPVRESIIKWAYKHCFKPVAYWWKHRGNNQEIWCQCCGHREPCDGWLVMSSEPYVCPECGAKCEVKAHRDRSTAIASYVSSIEVHKGIQVIRTFQVSRTNYNDGGKTFYNISELYQVWILEKGREVITTRGYDRSYNYMHWHYGNSYVIGNHSGSSGGYYIFEDVYDITNNYLYPRYSISPFFRKKGLSASVMRYFKAKNADISKAFLALIRDSKMETLIKTGYYPMFCHMIKSDTNISKYWKQINICHRNHYTIQDASLWCDYVDNLIELGLDTHNPKYICPKSLVTEHNQMVIRINRKRAKEKLNKMIAESLKDEKMFITRREKFFGLKFSGAHVSIVCIKSIKEVAYEGETLHHCVFTNRYYNKENSLLLSARDNVTGCPVETIEVDIRDMKILQSRGLQNMESEYHKEIMALLNKNIPSIAKIVHQNAEIMNTNKSNVMLNL